MRENNQTILLLDMKTNLVKIDRISGDFFKIKNDKDFHFMIGLNYGFFLKYLSTSDENLIDRIYQNKAQLNNIIEKIFVNDEFIILDEDEIEFVFEFISSVCNIILESDGIDFSNKHIIRYFKISQSVVKAISKATEKVKQTK